MRWCVLLAAELDHFARNCPHKEGGNRARGLPRARPFSVRPGVVAQESVVANDVNKPACVNNKVPSATSDNELFCVMIFKWSLELNK